MTQADRKSIADKGNLKVARRGNLKVAAEKSKCGNMIGSHLRVPSVQIQIQKKSRQGEKSVLSFFEIEVSEVPKSDDDAVKAKPHPLQVTMWLNQCNGSQRRTGGRGHSLRPNSPGLSDKNNTAAT